MVLYRHSQDRRGRQFVGGLGVPAEYLHGPESGSIGSATFRRAPRLMAVRTTDSSVLRPTGGLAGGNGKSTPSTSHTTVAEQNKRVSGVLVANIGVLASPESGPPRAGRMDSGGAWPCNNAMCGENWYGRGRNTFIYI